MRRRCRAFLPRWILSFTFIASCTHGLDTQLVQAVRKGQIQRVREVLRLGADPNATTASGWTPLVYSAARGDAELVKALLDAGAQADRSHRAGGRGWTPLIYAARNGHVVTVRLLIEAGARIQERRNGMTALSMARSRGHLPVAEMLIRAGAAE